MVKVSVRRYSCGVRYSYSEHESIIIPQLSKAGCLRLLQRSFIAYFSILSEASVLVTLNPSSSNIMESTLQPHVTKPYNHKEL